ncbi:MAG: DUF5011 domain-containing protein [Eubacterium sp.]|nr:DUF5011 domain-containing protein [Eubacterium sp.]
MKQGKVIGMVLAAVNGILAVVCIVLYFRTDRTEPRFIIQPAEITYQPDMEESFLYEGIAAHDDRDGDLTDKIVIEKKVENQAEGSVIIYYAVSDAAGNVAKFSKLFSAEYPAEVQVAGKESVMRQLEMDQAVQGNMEEITKDAVSETDTKADQEEDGGNEEETANDRGDAPDNGNGDAQAAPESVSPIRNTETPELVFRTTEVTIDAGTNVPWTEIISTLRDDKDDYATLYYNLQVSPYNRNKSGIYPVTVYTEDSDGNRSQVVGVTITVK